MTWAVVAALLAAGAVVPVALRWRPLHVAAARARARSMHAALLAALETTDSDARTVACAQERSTTCGGLLSVARSVQQCRLAERTAEQGLALLRSTPGERGRGPA